MKPWMWKHQEKVKSKIAYESGLGKKYQTEAMDFPCWDQYIIKEDMGYTKKSDLDPKYIEGDKR